MQLDKIRLKNITCFSDLEYNFSDLPDGLIAISGNNGSGKTTLLEAVCQILVDDIPSREGMSLYDICNSRDAEIELYYSLEGKNYRHLLVIDSENRKQEGYLYVDGETVTDGKIINYKKYCSEKIIDKLVFYSSIFNSQNNKGNFLDIPIKDRKALLIDMLGLNILQQISDKAKEFKNEKLNEINAIQNKIDFLVEVDQIEDLESENKVLQSNIQEIKKNVTKNENETKTKSQEILELKNKHADIIKNTDTINKQIEYYSSITNKLINTQEEIENKQKFLLKAKTELSNICLDSIQIDISNFELEKKQLEDNLIALSTNKELKSLEFEYNILKEDLDSKKEELTIAISRKEKEVSGLDFNNTKLNAEIENLERQKRDYIKSEKAFLSEQVKNVSSQIEHYKRQASVLTQVPCFEIPSCADCLFKSDALKAQGLLAQFNEKLEELNTKTDNIENKAKEKYDTGIETKKIALKASIKDLDNKKTDHLQLKNQLDTLISSFNTKNKNLINEINDLRQNTELKTSEINKLILSKTSEINNKKQYLKKQTELSTSFLIEINKTNSYIEEKQNLILEYQKILDQKPDIIVDDQSSLLSELANKINTINNDYKILVETNNTLKSKLDKDSQILMSNKIKIENQQKQKEEIKKLLKLKDLVNTDISEYTYLEQAFGKNGIQALEIDTACPEISELINELLRECFDDRFNVEINTLKEKVSDKGTFREAIEIMVIDTQTGHVGDIKQFSGGEKAIISIAIKLALSLFNASRNGGKFETLFLDETTSALSEETADLYAQMLEKARLLGNLKKIFYISHSPAALARADAELYLENGKIERIK